MFLLGSASPAHAFAESSTQEDSAGCRCRSRLTVPRLPAKPPAICPSPPPTSLFLLRPVGLRRISKLYPRSSHLAVVSSFLPGPASKQTQTSFAVTGRDAVGDPRRCCSVRFTS